MKKLIEQLLELLREIWIAHGDPNDANYNECQKDPCAWCSETQEIMEKLKKEFEIKNLGE